MADSWVIAAGPALQGGLGIWSLEKLVGANDVRIYFMHISNKIFELKNSYRCLLSISFLPCLNYLS